MIEAMTLIVKAYPLIILNFYVTIFTLDEKKCYTK